MKYIEFELSDKIGVKVYYTQGIGSSVIAKTAFTLDASTGIEQDHEIEQSFKDVKSMQDRVTNILKVYFIKS